MSRRGTYNMPNENIALPNGKQARRSNSTKSATLIGTHVITDQLPKSIQSGQVNLLSTKSGATKIREIVNPVDKLYITEINSTNTENQAILVQGVEESFYNFEARNSILSIVGDIFSDLPNYRANAIVSMIFNKIMYGVTYTHEEESIILYVLNELEKYNTRN